jgi:hypothetical protein
VSFVYLLNWKLISLIRLRKNKEAIKEFKLGWEDGKIVELLEHKKMTWITVIKMTLFLRPPII